MSRSVLEDARGDEFRPVLLLGVWAAVIFVFFSLSSSKLRGYIVPVFPALALLAAIALNSLDPAHWRRLVLVTVALVAVGLLALPILARLGESKGLTSGCQARCFRSAVVQWAESRGNDVASHPPELSSRHVDMFPVAPDACRVVVENFAIPCQNAIEVHLCPSPTPC